LLLMMRMAAQVFLVRFNFNHQIQSDAQTAGIALRSHIPSFGKPRKFVFPGSPIHLARRDNSLRLRQFRALRGGRVKIFHCCLNISFAA